MKTCKTSFDTATESGFRGRRRAVVAVLLALVALCGPSALAQNLIPANASFETTIVTQPVPFYEAPTFETWCRSGNLNAYADSNNPQNGSKNAVLYNYTTGGLTYYGLTFVGQVNPFGGTFTTHNLPAITSGQRYQVTFWAKRWVDEVTPTAPSDMGVVSPTSLSLPEARLTLQLSTATTPDLADGELLGDNQAFNLVAGGGPGAWTQGPWTQFTTTFTAPRDGYLMMSFKVKDPSQTWYGGNSVSGVKYGLDNVSVTVVPPPATPTVALAMHAGIAVSGSVGAHYQVEYATSLEPGTWLLLQDIPTLPTSPYLVYDSTPATQSARFYRAVLVP
jgi:hypothetical protein